jgi:hypothetical protein
MDTWVNSTRDLEETDHYANRNRKTFKNLARIRTAGIREAT